jgi:hypothetical protein
MSPFRNKSSKGLTIFINLSLLAWVYLLYIGCQFLFYSKCVGKTVAQAMKTNFAPASFYVPRAERINNEIIAHSRQRRQKLRSVCHAPRQEITFILSPAPKATIFILLLYITFF